MSTPVPPTGTLPPPGGTPSPGGGPGLPPPTPPSWRPVRASDGVLGGVCKGFAEAAGVDLTLVRLGFLAAALTGFGVFAYLILWIVVPREDPAAGRYVTPAPPETAQWLRVGLVIAAAIGVMSLLWRWTFGWFDPFPWDGPPDQGPGIFLGLLLIVVGAGVIWARRREHERDAQWRASRAGVDERLAAASSGAGWPAPTPTGPAAGPTTGSATGSVGTPLAGPPPTTPPTTSVGFSDATATRPTPTGAPLPPPPPQRLSAGVVAMRVIAWLVVIATILGTVAFGLLTFLVGALSVNVPGLAIAAIAVALVLVAIAASVARTVGPVLASLALLFGAVVLTAGLTRWDGEVGRETFRPLTVEEVPREYNLAAGHFVIDFSSLPVAEGTLPVTVDQAIGRLDVVLPDGVGADVRVEVLGGEARVLGQEDDGADATIVTSLPAEPGHGSVDLDVDFGFGQVRVCQAALREPGRTTCP